MIQGRGKRPEGNQRVRSLILMFRNYQKARLDPRKALKRLYRRRILDKPDFRKEPMAYLIFGMAKVNLNLADQIFNR
jgi:hypothetical protein